MYGVFFEDINRAADGGPYAELVQNRSFEYDEADNPSYTPLTAWTATGAARVADDAARLNERNRRSLRLDVTGAPAGVANAGYGRGITVTAGERYDFSVWARTTRPRGTRLTVTLSDGPRRLARALRLTVRGDRWGKSSGSLPAASTSTTGRLSVSARGAGTVRLDMVSLFPRDTFKHRRNGMRRDLAAKIAALRPAFLRFPGGCIVNTGSHEGYEAAASAARVRPVPQPRSTTVPAGGMGSASARSSWRSASNIGAAWIQSRTAAPPTVGSSR